MPENTETVFQYMHKIVRLKCHGGDHSKGNSLFGETWSGLITYTYLQQLALHAVHGPMTKLLPNAKTTFGHVTCS